MPHSINEVTNEDTVQCLIFAPSIDCNQTLFDNLMKNINSDIETIAHEYIWHRDELKVFFPIKDSDEELPYHLASSTCFGANIEDEWFVVHIILELTKRHKELIVHIKDNDGDFLLIEAADYLPSWANPESTENRVFIHNGHIHLIPPQIASLEQTLILKDAVQLILTYPDQTQASTDIEQAILKRIGNYPQKMYDNFHNALVEVPLDIAALLKLKPNLIAAIIDAYCNHDVIDAKSFKSVSKSNWVTVKVKFTKCLYAMLLYSKVVNSMRQFIGKDKKTTLGTKLAYGFQIIIKNYADIYSSKEYLKFVTSLKEHGYFKDNIEGSQEYNKLLQTAKDFFSAAKSPMTSNVSYYVNQIINTENYIKAKELLQNEESDCTEDNDEWLNIHPEQLNELLNSRYGKKIKYQKGDVLTPQAITTELKNFLKQTSDFEGIETNHKDPIENQIDFDADQFVNCIEKMLNILSTNNDIEDIESLGSDFSDGDMMQSEDEEETDKELKEKLHGITENLSDNKTILNNMVRGMKEEKASMGPSSNLISSIGLRKTDFLDSDDDDGDD